MNTFIFSDGYRIDGLTGNAIEASLSRNNSTTFNDDYRKNLTQNGNAMFDESKNFNRLKQADLSASKNGYVSFQIAVEDSTNSPSNIAIEFADLTGEHVISSQNFKVYFEWFHKLKGMLIPDLLVPWDKKDAYHLFETIPNHYYSNYSAFWIDLFVPKDTVAGDYEGSLVVKYGETSVTFPVKLKVFDVTLCNEALIHADMNNYADSLSEQIPHLSCNDNRFADGTYNDFEKKYYQLTHEHRGCFHLLPYSHAGKAFISFAPKIEGEGKNIKVSDWSLFDKHYAPYFDGTAFEGDNRGSLPVPYAYLPFCFDWPASYENWGKKGYKTESRRIMLDFIHHFEEKGWTNTVFEIFYNHKKRYRFFPYDGDETRHQHDEEIVDIYYDIFGDIIEETNVKIIFRTDSSWSFGNQYNTHLSNKIKMWTVSSGVLPWFPESYSHMKEQGTILWTYTGLPSMEADMTVILAYPMRCLMNDWGGFLYWNSTGAGSNFLDCPANNGTETLYYPAYPFGAKNDILGSVRLKYQRNAMQIVDMAKMYEGTPTFQEMKDDINAIYGITADKWYSQRPEFTYMPPNEWTNEMIGSASNNNVNENITPEAINHVKEVVLKKASEFVGGVSVWR